MTTRKGLPTSTSLFKGLCKSLPTSFADCEGLECYASVVTTCPEWRPDPTIQLEQCSSPAAAVPFSQP